MHQQFNIIYINDTHVLVREYVSTINLLDLLLSGFRGKEFY